jgi:beta-glucosidase
MGDGPAGVGNSMNNVTAFPAPVVSAASWNTSLQYAYGVALAEEHMMKGRNVVLSPTINIVRSPEWARAAESWSEDTYLTTRMAVAQVLGIQSVDGALACPKHFAAYNQDTNRFGAAPEYVAVDAIVDERVLREVYFPAFKAVVQEAAAASVMCSYNQLNGYYACENEWLLNTTLKHEWGFTGFVVTDWYFSQRSTVLSANSGLDISMPGGDLTAEYGFENYWGEPLREAVANGSVLWDTVQDKVARLWRPMFEQGAIDHLVPGNSTAVARTQEHLDLAQEIVEQGAVLLKNENQTLPLSGAKYTKIAMFGKGSTNATAVSELHGGFVIDETMVTQAPFDYISARGEGEGIEVRYTEAYPGTSQFSTIPDSMFSNLTAKWYTTGDLSGSVNQITTPGNITIATFPSELWESWPQVFSVLYDGIFTPNTTGTHYFSMYGQGDALLYVDSVLIANMSKQNFGNAIQGYATLTAGKPVQIVLEYSMAYSLSTGGYGVSLGLSTVANSTEDVDSLAAWADLSIVVVNDQWSEGADNNQGLSLPGDQDALIARVASKSGRTVVVLGTNSAVLMPWLDGVDAVLEIWYPGQQVGGALARLLYGDVSPAGRLPVTFPRALADLPARIGSALAAPFVEGLAVGYRAYDARGVVPLFPFGFGLGYSTFALGDLYVHTQAAAAAAENGTANATASVSDIFYRCSVMLSNTGDVDATEVVQVYVSFPEAAQEPPKLLKGFAKVALEAGEETAVTIDIKREDLQVWSETLEAWTFISGEYTFMAGFSSRDIVTSKVLKLC